MEQVKNSRLDSLALPPLPLLQTLDLRDNKVNLRLSVLFLSLFLEMEVGLPEIFGRNGKGATSWYGK